MAKFPSQNKIMYAGATASNGDFAQTHLLCLPKDVGILNRRGYASTTRKGVPLVYKVAATVYPTGLDGSGYVTNVSSDVKTTVKFLGCQNNWVMKNAAVKYHAAREAMIRKAGVKKSERGAYAHEIRYNWSASNDDGRWHSPVDGDGNAFTGGTWDSTKFFTDDRAAGFQLKLIGTAQTEDSAESGLTVQQIGYSYLASRATVPDDSNLESSSTPADHSLLRQLLAQHGTTAAVSDEIADNVQGEQDNPPYDLFVPGDVNHDISESVELGRLNLFPQGSGGSLPMTVILDVPFGIMEVQMAHRDPGDNSGITDGLALGIEILGISEMQG